MHFYSQNIGDYRRKTMGLTPLEHGVYRLLLDTYYLEEKPLTLDDAEAMRSHNIRTTDEQNAYQYVVQKFFKKTAKGYTHKRCDEEIEAFYGKSEKARQAANLRWERERQAEAMRLECERIANGMLPQDTTTSIPQDTNTLKPKKPPVVKSTQGTDSSAGRASRLPADWVLPKLWGEWALTEKPAWDAADVRRVAEIFKDHWVSVPGAKGCKLDWLATWRNWVRKEPDSKKGNGKFLTPQQQRDENNKKSGAEFIAAVTGDQKGRTIDHE